MSELDAAETMAQALLEISAGILEQGEMSLPVILHGAVRMIRLQKAEIDRARNIERLALAQVKETTAVLDLVSLERNELRAELAKLRARLNDLHDVPPEHESEPLAFHKGWELAVRAVAHG
jgi:chromosome segregation ATPase